MLKTLSALALVLSTLSVSPVFAATTQAPRPDGLSFAAVMHKPLPWCSAHVKTHCRHHHTAKAPAPAAKTM